MQQLGYLNEDEVRIKEELFMLLYFFIMTYSSRSNSIKNIIKKNKENLVEICIEFKDLTEEEDNKALMDTMINTLETMSDR
jgi:hypothetical protein